MSMDAMASASHRYTLFLESIFRHFTDVHPCHVIYTDKETDDPRVPSWLTFLPRVIKVGKCYSTLQGPLMEMPVIATQPLPSSNS